MQGLAHGETEFCLGSEGEGGVAEAAAAGDPQGEIFPGVPGRIAGGGNDGGCGCGCGGCVAQMIETAGCLGTGSLTTTGTGLGGGCW